MLCAAVLVVLAATLYGGEDSSSGTVQRSLHPPTAQQVPPAAPQAVTPPPQTEPPATAEKQLPPSQPTLLHIPKILVKAPFIPLALDAKGQLEAPPADNVNLVGWYAKGASPGELGTSIIAGHVDTTTSAAVFARLRELRKGDVFHVARADGLRASFVVDSVETFKKDKFPNDRVYADTNRAEVRLITCAGVYDRSAKDYPENLVVFAHLV
ncbi:class F sortase [Streptomyces sp. NPDC048825]|uniref:class F sortase n=1 Tax=Streptomyces sp. NPDC048825 TaxID=3365592 RepID=UPI003719E11C